MPVGGPIKAKRNGVTGASLVVLLLSWVFNAQATHSLVLLVVGVVAWLDFAVQAVHVTSQNLIVANTPESSGQIIGSYMVFYSLGSAAGAVSTTMVFDAAGWGAASILGGAYAFAALIAWTIDRLRTRNILGSWEPRPGRDDQGVHTDGQGRLDHGSVVRRVVRRHGSQSRIGHVTCREQ